MAGHWGSSNGDGGASAEGAGMGDHRSDVPGADRPAVELQGPSPVALQVKVSCEDLLRPPLSKVAPWVCSAVPHFKASGTN
jgi:hypothetical protein